MRQRQAYVQTNAASTLPAHTRSSPPSP